MSIATFLPEAVLHFKPTAAVLPSARALAKAMVEPLPLDTASVVVEFGPGTGPMTRELLHKLPAEAKLLAFETNPRFCRYLEEQFRDPRLVVLNEPAEYAAWRLQKFGYARVDSVVSTLGLTLMPEETRHRIFRNLAPFVGDGTVLTQVQYLHRWGMGPLLRKHFREVSHRTVWGNVPPAGFFVCRRYANLPVLQD